MLRRTRSEYGFVKKVRGFVQNVLNMLDKWMNGCNFGVSKITNCLNMKRIIAAILVCVLGLACGTAHSQGLVIRSGVRTFVKPVKVHKVSIPKVNIPRVKTTVVKGAGVSTSKVKVRSLKTASNKRTCTIRNQMKSGGTRLNANNLKRKDTKFEVLVPAALSRVADVNTAAVGQMPAADDSVARAVRDGEGEAGVTEVLVVRDYAELDEYYNNPLKREFYVYQAEKNSDSHYRYNSYYMSIVYYLDILQDSVAFESRTSAHPYSLGTYYAVLGAIEKNQMERIPGLLSKYYTDKLPAWALLAQKIAAEPDDARLANLLSSLNYYTDVDEAAVAYTAYMSRCKNGAHVSTMSFYKSLFDRCPFMHNAEGMSRLEAFMKKPADTVSAEEGVKLLRRAWVGEKLLPEAVPLILEYYKTQPCNARTTFAPNDLEELRDYYTELRPGKPLPE